MRKGITPIISTIVLLLITVALAGAAWAYLGGFMSMYTEKTIVASSNSALCIGQTFRVTINNAGKSPILTGDINAKVLNSAGVSAAGCTMTASPPLPLNEKKSTEFSCTTTETSAGLAYTILLVAGTSTVRETVVCSS